MCFGNSNFLSEPIPSVIKNIFLLAYSGYLLKKETQPLHLLESSVLNVLIVAFLYAYSAFNIGVSPVNVQYITLEELTKDNFSEITINNIFIDARPPNLYAEEHILYAINLPYYDIGMNLSPAKKYLKNKSKRVITYCDSQVCTLSKKLAYSLSQKINIKVYILKGGLENWKKHKLPTSINQ